MGTADEGVCLLVQVGPYSLLLDCGLSDIKLLQPILPKINGVWCSHAHADHARGLLALHHEQPDLPIYASETTAKLLSLNWPDQTFQEGLPWCQPLPWKTPIELFKGLSVTLYPAGHLPGAATLVVRYTPNEPHSADSRSIQIVYTGDYCLSPSRLVDGLPLEDLRGLQPDVLIVEGSYGTARLPRRRHQENHLAECMSQALAQQHSILLPVAPLGLGQELLMLLRSHHLFTGRQVEIWVDPVVANACDAYLQLLSTFPSPVQNFARHQPLFWDDRVYPHARRLETLHDLKSSGQAPCIALVDRNSAWQQDWQALLQTWHLFLPESEQELSLNLGETDTVTMLEQAPSITFYRLAEHCDQLGTTQLIHNLRPQHVVFTHGSPTNLNDLASLEELYSRYQLHIPSIGSCVDLPIGDIFHQPHEPEVSYEGALLEAETDLTIALPRQILTSPHWLNFADTGVVEARWQGDALVIRGVSQIELRRRKVSKPLGGSELLKPNTCGTCLHYRRHVCAHPGSALYGLQLSAQESCDQYEPITSSRLDPDQSEFDSGE
jgi:Cft2 family RNA processing exonuclease